MKSYFIGIFICFNVFLSAQDIPNSLAQCFGMALRNNVDIEVQEPLVDIADEDITFAKSPFDDTLLTAGFSYDKAETLFLQEDLGNFNIGVTKRFLTGTAVNLRYDLEYRRSSDFDIFQDINSIDQALGLNGLLNDDDLNIQKLWTSALTLQVNQPLLRNFGVDVNETNINLARKQKKIADYEIERQVNDTLRDVEIAYWTWVSLLKVRGVLENSISRTQEYKEKFVEQRVGVEGVLPSDVDQSTIDIKRRRDFLIRTEKDIKVWEDRLRRLIYPFDAKTIDVFSQKLPAAGDAMGNFQVGGLSTQGIPEFEYDVALKYRPELKQVEEQVSGLNLVIDERKNFLLPRLDVTAGVSFAGEEEGTNTSLRRTFKGESYQWQVGVVFEYPIGNTGAQSQLDKAKNEKKRAKAQLNQAQYDVCLEIRLSHHSVVEALEKYKNLSEILEKANTRLESLERRNNNPLPGDFNLIFFLQDSEFQATQALTDLYQAILEYKIAYSSLKRAQAKYIQNVYMKYKKN